GDHPRAGGRERLGDGEQERTGTGHDDALADGQSLTLGERLCGTGGEHAGEVPARERERTVVRTRGEHYCGRLERHPLPATAVDLADDGVHDWLLARVDGPHVRAEDDLAPRV